MGNIVCNPCTKICYFLSIHFLNSLSVFLMLELTKFEVGHQQLGY